MRRRPLALALTLLLLAPISFTHHPSLTTRRSPVVLPADAAMHPGAPVEWWYVVGHLADATGHTYGFETTFFKFAGLRRYFPGSPVDTAYRTDVAITDEAAGHFHEGIAYAPAAPPRTVASTTRLQLRGATLSMSTTGTLSYSIHGATPDGHVDLTVVSRRPPMLVNGGFLGWGTGYTYYYSLTHLAAAGMLTIDQGHAPGSPRRIPVHGIAWMDHQWGDMSGSSVTGWQWMALQLSDGTDASLVNERPANLAWSQWAQALLPDNRQVFVRRATITPLGSWRSPTTGTVYPSGWRVRVPGLSLNVVVRPTVRDQEMVDRFPVMGHMGSYWEGSCLVSGTRAGHRVTGKAYTELTGYNRL